MDALKAIFSRRSIRKYLEKPVPAAILTRLVEAGMQAPSARNKQPWHFIVITKRENLDALADAHPYAAMMKQAAAAIVVCGDRKEEETDLYLVQNCSAATQNILLAAHAQGLGAVWLGLQPRKERVEAIKEILDIPGHIYPVSLISIGYPDEKKEPVKRYDATKVTRERFGEKE